MQTVEIRVKGCLGKEWSDWFGDLAITHSGQDETVLSGNVTDQAMLYGVIARLRDLGLPLLSVTLGENAGQSRPGIVPGG